MNDTIRKRSYFLLGWGGLAILVAMFLGLGIVVWFVWGQNAETNDWIAVEAIATLVGVVPIVLGVPFAVYQLSQAAGAQKRQSEVVSAQHIIALTAKWGDDQLQEARQEVNSFESASKLTDRLTKLEEKGNKEEYYKLARIPDFFEELGLLVYVLKVIQLDPIEESLGTSIMFYWDWYEPSIRAIRNTQNHPTLYKWFEKLRNELVCK